MKNNIGLKSLILIIVAGSISIFFLFDLDNYLTLSNLNNSLDELKAFYMEHKMLAGLIYFFFYVLISALSLPAAGITSLAGGALFGFFYGTLMVSFASALGGTLAFLASRYLFKNLVQDKFPNKIAAVNRGIDKEGGFYLFTLRLIAIFPFFVINLAMGLTSIRITTFYLVSQIGMLPATMVFINAGTQLASITSPKDILSLNIILSFALLGIFPLIAKRFIQYLRRQKVYSKFSKPVSYDYNLVVIGGGSAGLVASYIAAAVKAKVALVEENKMGGDCLNTGCVPSKSLIASAKLVSYTKRAEEFGLNTSKAGFDFKNIMERIQSIIKKTAPHDSIERYTDLGVDCIKGRARILSPFQIKVNEKIISTRNIIIATGAKPIVPDLPGIEQIEYLTSDNIWDLRTLPSELVVLGGGPIGCELAQSFARLGSNVTLVQRGSRILKKEDPDASEIVQERFKDEGINVLLNHSTKRIQSTAQGKELILEHNNKDVAVKFDKILIALGRSPNVTGFGLEELGVEFTEKGDIETNELLQTSFPNIYLSGDVRGKFQFTHTAAHESWYSAVNALFGKFKQFRVSYNVIPWATYTDPEVARVGLNETEAEQSRTDFEIAKYEIKDLDRAITDSEDYGFVKVLTVPGKDTILGVTIVGNHAADTIAEFVLAMKYSLGLNKILGTIHIYPTMAEANKYAAGIWKKNHAPERLLAWIKKYHTWMRKQKKEDLNKRIKN